MPWTETCVSECYIGSTKEFPYRLPQVSYPDHMQVRIVYLHGDTLYFGKRLFVSESLGGEYIGIEQISEDISWLWYCDYLLGQIDHKKWQINPRKCYPCSRYKVLPMFRLTHKNKGAK